MTMDSPPDMDEPVQLSSPTKVNKAADSSYAVEKQLEHGLLSTKKLIESSSNIAKEKLEADLREMERLVGLDQVLEARVVVDKIQKTLKNSSNNDDYLISDERREIMNDIIVESNDANKLLHDMDNDDGWTPASHKKNIIIHYRDEPESPLQSVKLETIFENFTSQDFVRLIALFNEAEFLPDWFPKGVIKKCAVLSEPAKYTKVVRFFMSFGILPLSPRDAVQIGKGFHLPQRNAALIVAKSIPECRYCDLPSPDKGYVRIESFAAFYIQLLDNNRVLFRQISHDDMKLKHVPPMILNFLARGGMPYEVINSIRKVMAKFEGSVWDKRMQEKKEYYKEIEDRVVAEKLKMNDEKKKAKTKHGAVTWASTVSSTRSVEKGAMKDSTTSSREASSQKTTNYISLSSILSWEQSNFIFFFLPLVVIAWVLYFVFEPSINNEQSSQKDEISYPEHYVLPVLFLLGCAVPVMLKTTPTYSNIDRRNHREIISTNTEITSNAITSSESSSSLIKTDDSYSATDESLTSNIVTSLADDESSKGMAEGSDNTAKHSHRSSKKMHNTRKVVSKAGRAVGRVLSIHKIKKNSKRKTPKQADLHPSQ